MLLIFLNNVADQINLKIKFAYLTYKLYDIKYTHNASCKSDDEINEDNDDDDNGNDRKLIIGLNCTMLPFYTKNMLQLAVEK
jgi:hypothetical protein